MYDIVEIGLNQKVPSATLNLMGTLSRAAMIAATRHFLTANLVFADFTFTVQGFTITASDGFLYKNGAQYKTVGPTSINLVGDTPPSTGLKRIVSIVAYATPAHPDATELREFATVVTPATPTAAAVYQTETRQTTTINRQSCSVARVLGDIAPQPSPPLVPADQCVLATVVLSVSGIDSVTIVESNRAPNVEKLRQDVATTKQFIDGVGKRLDTIDKNLAAVSSATSTPTPDDTIRQVVSALGTVIEATRTKVGDVAFGTDLALDERWTDKTVAGFAATVDDGIRFPWTSVKESPLNLYTPGDSAVKVVSNLVLPTWTEEARITVSGKDGELSISNQINSVTTAVQRTISRSSVSYGTPFTVCNNSAYWQSGNYNAAANIFTRDGEVFNVVQGYDYSIGAGYPAGTHQEQRLTQVWTDTWSETYWDYVTTQIGVNGTIRGQTFRVPDFGYLTSIDLPFTTKDAAEGVTLMLCETKNGLPNILKVIEKCNLAPGDIVADTSGNVRTKFPIRPAFVDPANLYSWVTVTKGNYALATVKGNKFAQGTSVNSTDQGDLFVGDVDVDFAFVANFARFATPRSEVRLTDIDNANGDVISALKLLYGSVIPSGCDIIHQIRRSGGDWVTAAIVNKDKRLPPIVDAGPFSTLPLPASVQHKIIFLGTTTLMPAIDFSQAWVQALKLGATMNHFTQVLNLGVACNRAEVQVVVDGPFNPAQHTTGCNLIVGGSTIAPSATTTKLDPNKTGKRTITYTYSFTSTTSFRINLTGALNNLLSTYHVDNRFFRAWSV